MAQKLISQATLFLDTGKGRNLDESLSKEIYYANNGWSTVTAEFKFEEFPCHDGIKSVLFRPSINLFAAYTNFKFWIDGKQVDLGLKTIDAEYVLQNDSTSALFLTTDPLYSLDISKFNKILIEYDIRPLSFDEISQAINYKNQLIALKDTITYISSEIKGKIKRKIGLKQENFSNNEYDTFCKNLITSSGAKLEIFHETYNEVNKKILFVVHSGEKHGSILMFKNLIEIAKAEYKIDPIILVLTSDFIRKDFEKLGYVYDLDINYFDINLRKSELNKYLQQVKNLGCHQAICNSLTTGIVTDSLKENGFHITLLVHEMPELVEFNNLTKAAALAFKYADNLVFPANYVLEQYIDKETVFSCKTHIIPQGLYNVKGLSDFGDKTEYKKKICQKLDCDENSNIVLGCGTGYLVKGIDYFVDVAVNVINKIPNTQFIWIGHFDQAFDNMGKILAQRQINLTNMENNIHLFDFVDNPTDYFAAADIYFLPSRNDTFPSTVLEAAASFTPSVIFEGAGGMQDFVKDGVNGRIVDYCNAESAKESLITLFQGRNALKNIAINAHEQSQLYSMDAYVDKIMKILFR